MTGPPGGDDRPGHKRGPASTARDPGFATVEYIAAVGLSLLLLVAVANFITVQYAQGVLRAAVDEGAREGARYFPDEAPSAVEARCEHRAQEVLGNLLRGEMGRRLTLRCTATATDVAAAAGGTLEGWLPGIPAIDVGTRAIATRARR